MTQDQLKKRIESLSPGTECQLVDLTGTQDHWQAVIVSPVFEGKSTIERHRMVFALLDKEVASNEVHALTIKTYTPSQYATVRS